MTNDIKLDGDLRDHPFAKLVGNLVLRGATGALEVYDPIGVSRAFFLKGAPQGARLSRLKHPIGRILVDERLLTEDKLNEALAVHNRTDKLLGQVLLEMRLLTEDQLNKVMARQSQLNFLTLFAAREGRFEFLNGLVHLTDFTPAPMEPLMALYLGVRDFARPEVMNDLMADLAFNGVALKSDKAQLIEQLPPAEKMAIKLLEQPRFTGELARSLPLPVASLRSLLFAMHQLGALEVIAANQVPRTAG